MKYKIIAVDMDGTLLKDDKHISDYNLSMIEKAKEKGAKFVISSGRIPSGLKFYEATVSKNQPMICCNGAIILNENKNIIHSNPIYKENAFKVIDILKEHKDTYFHFYNNGVMCSEQFKFSTKRFYDFNKKIDKEFRIDIKIVENSKEYISSIKTNIDKIVVIDEDLEYLEILRKRIDSIPGIETTKSDIDNIEVVSQGASKGNALKILAKHYGISIEECIAIGNDENDISMIKCAGLGVAVDNARDMIKNTADFVTENDNNNGAVGEVIEKFVL